MELRGWFLPDRMTTGLKLMRDRGRMLVLAAGLLVLQGARPLHAADPAVLEAEQKRIEKIQQVAPAVVAVFGPDGGGGGSGVLITPDGYALSNFHVTSACGDFMKCGLNDGVLYDAVIVGVDPAGDVALLKLLGRDDFPTAPLGDSDRVRAGDWVYVMGNPFLLATDYHPTVTYGIVSGVHRYQYPAAGDFLEYPDCIQVDASINPGNSGGPLFNADGELIGINGRGSFEKRGRVNVGAGYAISINQIKHFLDHLRGGLIVDHATLGATVRSGEGGAVLVDRILERSEAFRRGLREGDEIVSFGGRPLGSVNQFKNILGIYPQGWTLPLTFRRDGKKQDIFVELRTLHRESEMRPGRNAPPEEPQPKPKPDGEEPKEKPDDKAPKPRRMNPHQKPKAEPPAQYKDLFVEKDGFANYYFNQLHQDRVLKGLQPLGSWQGMSGLWTFNGKVAAGMPFAFKLGTTGLGVELGEPTDPKRLISLQSLDGSDWQDEPPGSGGLLAAWHHLRLLLSGGREAFGEFLYFGSEPLDGRGEVVDVLVSSHTGIRTRWFFRKSDGALAGWDTALETDTDPCEIRILEWDESGPRRFPRRFTVRCGDVDFGDFLITAWTAAAAPTGEGQGK